MALAERFENTCVKVTRAATAIHIKTSEISADDMEMGLTIYDQDFCSELLQGKVQFRAIGDTAIVHDSAVGVHNVKMPLSIR